MGQFGVCCHSVDVLVLGSECSGWQLGWWGRFVFDVMVLLLNVAAVAVQC